MMDHSIFRYIWRFSKRDQLVIIAIVLLSLPFYFLSLDLPKIIVNQAIQGEGFSDEGIRTAFRISLPESWWSGATLLEGWELERVSFLVWMSISFLVLVLVNGGFKLIINTAKGRLGERMLRRLRYMLFERILRFPYAHFRKAKAPELATMIKDEIEPLGGFIGDAYVQPVFLGGQTLTALAFIVTQNAWLGLLAGGIALIQAMLIPKLRAPILKLGRERQLQARDLAGRIGEAVDGIEQIQVNDTRRFERAEMASRLGGIFWIRFQLYQKKFSVKFVNNILSQMTPFLFYLIGGYLAIKGKLDVGQLIAVIVAYKDLPGPMKELIDWDQRRQDTQIKYEQVISQFAPDGLLDPSLSDPREGYLGGPLTLSNVTLAEDGERPMVDHVSVSLDLSESVALIGPGAARLIEAVARLRVPISGEIKFGDQPLNEVPHAVFGRSVAYLAGNVYLRGPTVLDTLAYALKRRPSQDGGASIAAKESIRTGNSVDDPSDEWIDYEAAGVSDMSALRDAMLDTMSIVEMEDDLYSWGLREPVQADAFEPGSILRARAAVSVRLEREGLSMLIERFDTSAFNGNATVAENLRFGAALSPNTTDSALAQNQHMRAVLEELGLDRQLSEVGRRIGATLLEIFADISPDNPLFEQFNFAEASDLPLIRKAVENDQPSAEGRDRLLELAFAYVDVRHRLDVLADDTKAAIIEARSAFRTRAEREDPTAVAFYDPNAPTPGARLIDDILYGRVSHRYARSREQVEALMFEALDAEKLLPIVLRAGLNYDIGPGGRRLSTSQRQRIGLAGALLRRPDILLLNDAMVVVDEMQARRILTRTVGLRAGNATFAALARPQYAPIFSRRISFEDGQLLADEFLGAQKTETTFGGGINDEVAVLAQIPLFANVEPATLKLLAFASERVTFVAGQALFRQGDAASCAYVIISGSADVILERDDGPSKIASVSRHHLVGELALLSDGPRSATVQVTEDIVALEITKDLFFQMIRDFPGVSLAVLRDVGHRLRRTTEFAVKTRGDVDAS